MIKLSMDYQNNHQYSRHLHLIMTKAQQNKEN
jgi:hypothetical protein